MVSGSMHLLAQHLVICQAYPSTYSVHVRSHGLKTASAGEPPDATLGRLVGQRELGQSEVGREIVEDDADPLADRQVLLGRGSELGRDEIRDDAEGLVGG